MTTTWDALIPEKVLTTGRTSPVVVSCEATEGAERRQFVTKLLGLPEVTRSLWCRELLANLIADRLGVRVPKAAVINVSEDFVESTQPFFAQRGLSVQAGECFGCEYIPGMANITTGTTDSLERLAEAARIYALDMALQNPDRTSTKPNCAVAVEGIVAFDFDQAFSFLYLLGPKPDPWAVTKMGPLPRQHFFHRVLRRQPPCNWAPFLSDLATLTDVMLGSFHEAIPLEWREGSSVDAMITHVTAVRDNADEFHAELKKSLL